MVDKKGILELRRRFKKDVCTITTLTGCYVNSEKEKVTTFRKNLLNLDDAEYFKYLQIIKKSLSGQVRKNLLGLEFDEESSKALGMKQFLKGLNAGELENDDMLNMLYDRIIAEYDYPGHFIILTFYDTYDVIKKTNDNMKLDESEDVYSYFICSICPVSLSKPGLGYNVPHDEFEPVEQDWIINNPDIAFLYPSFTERSSDDAILTYYTRKPLETHPEIAKVLGCNMQKTSAEERECLKDIIKKHVSVVVEDADKIILDVQQNLMDKDNMDREETIFDPSVVTECLEECNIPESQVTRINKEIISELPQNMYLEDLYDEKEIMKSKKDSREQELLEQISQLKENVSQNHVAHEDLIKKLQSQYPAGTMVSIDEIIQFIRN